MMGACTFSVPVGSVQFVKFGEYSRKITLYTATFGVLGVLAAVFLVKNLNVTMLKWLVIVVLIYSAYSMLSSLMKARKSNRLGGKNMLILTKEDVQKCFSMKEAIEVSKQALAMYTAVTRKFL